MANQILTLLVELDFQAQPVRLHSGVGTIAWNGGEWLGVGALGKISNVSESTDLQPARIKLALSGVPPETIAISLGEHYQGRRARIWLALVDEATDGVGMPILLFSGMMDSMTGTLGETGEITVTLENRLAAWLRPRDLRFNEESHRLHYPADRGFEFLAATTEKSILWGRTFR